MNELTSPALAGAAAGIGVAMPMGAMSVLLLREALTSRRSAVAAAAGVATTDVGYAALAVLLGPWVAARVGPIEGWVRLGAALVLLLIAAHGLYASRPSAAADPAAGAPRPARPLAVFARYAALTAVNPTTALYFAALTTAQGDRLRAGAAGLAFVCGVALASGLWQQTLVAAGSLAGGRLSARVRTWSFRLGHGLVAGYALVLAHPLPF
ncbi:LysE family transporter [Streptomyces sp. BI20]|uniref:LysE family transporter n=1 Tax=Streptomyces sp. BI20 TaxID=3403460 RepID=UPI003C72AB77